MLQRNFLQLSERIALCSSLILFVVALSGCSQVETDIRGAIMGTTYSVKIITGRFDRTTHLKELINERLETVDNSMSTYIEENEITRFNSTPANTPFTPSPDFLAVMQVAAKIHKLSAGAWDGSIDPLVTLWGFGRDEQINQPPADKEIQKRLKLVDFGKIIITPDGKFIKTEPGIHIDLASIAKGYGVDAIANLLYGEGYENFLIEVGGEIYTSGKKNDTTPWRVGINTPSRSAGFGDIYDVVSIENKCIATSGDYRNYFVADGQTYSHILDPRTGYPVNNGVVSVSVIASSCTFADGLATALMVMGPRDGIKLAEEIADVEAFFIVRNETEDKKFREIRTSAFAKFEQ